MLTDDLWREGLTPKQQNLIPELYFAKGNLTPEVWKAAGYSSGATAKKWKGTLQYRKAMRRFSELQTDSARDFTKAAGIDMLCKIAFYNPADIIDSEGKLLPKYGRDVDGRDNLKKLNGFAVCIEGIETSINKMGIKETKVRLVNMANRLKAFEMLSELLDFKGENSEDYEDSDCEKPVYYMSDEERQKQIDKYLEKAGYKRIKKIEGKKK